MKKTSLIIAILLLLNFVVIVLIGNAFLRQNKKIVLRNSSTLQVRQDKSGEAFKEDSNSQVATDEYNVKNENNLALENAENANDFQEQFNAIAEDENEDDENEDLNEILIDENSTGSVGEEGEVLVNNNEMSACQTDESCVAKPGCHPTECINIKFKSNFENVKNLACTEVFYTKAVYDDEDCLCRGSVCVNANLNRPAME